MRGFNPTKKDLEKKQKERKIKGFIWPLDDKGNPIKPEKISREKKWMNVRLHDWGIRKGIVIINEYKFLKTRKWRFDWCTGVDRAKIAWEYEGLMSKKSRHTTVTGYSGDTEKYNAGEQAGWTIYRYTALTYKNLIADLEKIKI